MDAYYLLIAFVCGGPNGIEYAINQPPLQVLPHLQVVGIEEESVIPIRPRQLLGYFLSRLAVQCLALRSCGRMDRVAGHVESVLAAADAPFSVAAFTHLLSSSPILPPRARTKPDPSPASG